MKETDEVLHAVFSLILFALLIAGVFYIDSVQAQDTPPVVNYTDENRHRTDCAGGAGMAGYNLHLWRPLRHGADAAQNGRQGRNCGYARSDYTPGHRRAAQTVTGDGRAHCVVDSSWCREGHEALTEALFLETEAAKGAGE